MIEHDSVLKTVVGRKVFHFYSYLGKYPDKTCLSLKGFDEKVKESDENFEVMFHLRRSDFENWIIKALKGQESACQTRTSTAILPASRIRGDHHSKATSASHNC